MEKRMWAISYSNTQKEKMQSMQGVKKKKKKQKKEEENATRRRRLPQLHTEEFSST